ncbi:MAG TPA: aminotransferase class V-fold PLP-dependent enzyme [Leptolyngbyaceae cyanobacterium M65_K2018_010]|nr:aminotransferase class V-fold PLP-dependent enzyme [Leptolyngbyaceae cyanobacterium M65_K2018_010]
MDRLTRHRQQFPALERSQYFNYGGQGPMAQATLEAIFQAHQQIQTLGPFSQKVNQWVVTEAMQTRQTIAAELNVPTSTISLTEDVTLGCNIPLWGLPWQRGDHILLSDCEHPGVVAAVQEICRRYGVTYTVCPLMQTVNGGDPVAVIADHLRPSTRLLIISHIFWNTGQVLPLKAITQLCHSQPSPVWVLADAAQSVGCLPLDLTDLEVDFYAFTGHKWWCGPAGLAGLYVSPRALEAIQPTFIGWRSITTDASGNPTGWKPDGQRFEVATSDYALLAGLRTAIALQSAWGTPGQRYQRLCQLGQRLWHGLAQVPQIRRVRQTRPDSGLVSFWVLQKGEPSPPLHHQLVERLEAEGTFLRTLLMPHCVRACVHYLTLEAEVDQLVETLGHTLAQMQA